MSLLDQCECLFVACQRVIGTLYEIISQTFPPDLSPPMARNTFLSVPVEKTKESLFRGSLASAAPGMSVLHLKDRLGKCHSKSTVENEKGKRVTDRQYLSVYEWRSFHIIFDMSIYLFSRNAI